MVNVDEAMAPDSKQASIWLKHSLASLENSAQTLLINALVGTYACLRMARLSGSWASAALVKIGEPAVPRILSLLNGRYGEAPLGDVWSMMLGIGSPALPHIVNFLEAGSGTDRIKLVLTRCIQAIWDPKKNMDDPRIIPLLISFVGSKDPDLQCRAIDTLGTKDVRAIPAFASALESQGEVFESALLNLWMFGAASVPALAKALRNPKLVSRRQRIMDVLERSMRIATDGGNAREGDAPRIENIDFKKSLMRQRKISVPLSGLKEIRKAFATVGA